MTGWGGEGSNLWFAHNNEGVIVNWDGVFVTHESVHVTWDGVQ